MSKVRYDRVQTYPLLASATVTAGNFVKSTTGYVSKDTSSLSTSVIGQVLETKTDNSSVTGLQDYVSVVKEGRVAATGMVEGSGGTYKTAIALGDVLSLYVSSGVQYLVKSDIAPIGRVVEGTVASSGTTADTTGTVVIDLDLTMEHITVDEIPDATVTLAKLENVTAARVIVGSAANVPTAVAMSGDVGIDNAGATTIQPGAVGASKLVLAQGAVLRGATGGAAAEEVAPGTANQIFQMDGGGGYPGFYTMSGDATNALGVITLSADMKSDIITVGCGRVVEEYTFPWNVTTLTEAGATFAKIEDWDAVTPEFSDLSTSSSLGGVTADYQLFPDTEVENDAVYFGEAAPFGMIQIDMSATNQTYNADSLAWEYWDGGAWASLSIAYDQTDTTAQDGLRSFQQDGYIVFGAPTDWATTTIDSQSAFWIRARCNATVDITQIGLTNSKEHHTVSSATATKMVANGTIGRGRFAWETISGANNDTKLILYNFTSGECSAVSTLTQATVEQEVANFALVASKDDFIGFWIVQEDGTTEFAGGTCELAFTKD